MLWKVRHSATLGPLLEPASQEAEDWIVKKKTNDTYFLSAPKKARSPDQHRKFWSVAKRAWENWPEKRTQFSDKETFVHAILCFMPGYHDVWEAKNGDFIRIPHSLSYANMDGEKFTSFFDEFVSLCAKAIGCTEEDLLND